MEDVPCFIAEELTNAQDFDMNLSTVEFVLEELEITPNHHTLLRSQRHAAFRQYFDWALEEEDRFVDLNADLGA
jgi:hypothetical protein